MSAATPPPPPLDDELMRLLKRMRLPYIRNAAPALLATAKVQRWEPAEVLKALLAEEVNGRDRSALATRRTRAAFPPVKPSPHGIRPCRPSRRPPRPHCVPWNGSTAGKTW